jgi:hypothetical protein
MKFINSFFIEENPINLSYPFVIMRIPKTRRINNIATLKAPAE